MSPLLAIGIILLCVMGEAFFSGSEIALVSVDRLQIRHAAKKGHRASRNLQDVLKNPEWILGTTLLGTNICTVTSTTLAATQFYAWLGALGVPLSIVIMTFVNLVFAEIVPKSVFQQKSDQIAPRIIYILRIVMVVLFPLVWLFSRIAILLAGVFGKSESSEKRGFVSKEELKMLMRMKHDKGDVKPSERRMINRLLNFTETSVREIMVPLIDVAALSDKAKVGDAYDRFIQTKHRRLPVFRDRVDKIIGILNSFDILGELPAKSIKLFIRPAFYVPPTMGISELLEDLQSNGKNMAIVVDEFGGAEGVVTVEDILEEVVGDIEDEYDIVENLYRTDTNGSIIVNGRMPVDDLNDRLKLSIPEGDYETIGGFVISHKKRIPKIGEKILLRNLELIVSKSGSRTIGEVIIRRLNPEDEKK
jgi:putative hemolysin